MKKFMFSAIAMIAFVGSSMANNSQIKVDKLMMMEQVTFSGCSNVYLETYQAAIDNGANNDQASEVAWRAYKACLDIAPQNP